MGYLQRKHTKDQKYEINRLEMEMRDASAAYERKNADKPDKHNLKVVFVILVLLLLLFVLKIKMNLGILYQFKV